MDGGIEGRGGDFATDDCFGPECNRHRYGEREPDNDAENDGAKIAEPEDVRSPATWNFKDCDSSRQWTWELRAETTFCRTIESNNLTCSNVPAAAESGIRPGRHKDEALLHLDYRRVYGYLRHDEHLTRSITGPRARQRVMDRSKSLSPIPRVGQSSAIEEINRGRATLKPPRYR